MNLDKLAKKDFVSLIPLRGGSKGIPRKNLKILCGKPLFAYVVEASIKSELRTVISTEDQEIKDMCKKLFADAEVIDRPNEIARDTSTTEEVIDHFLKIENRAKHIILLQATSPLTSSDDINGAIDKYLIKDKMPLVSVVNEHCFLWDSFGNPINYDPYKRPRRQDWDGINKENGALYIFSRDHFEKHKCRAGKKVTLYKMMSKTKYEIDEIDDFEILNSIIKKKMKTWN